MNNCNKKQINDYDIFYCTKDALKNFKPIIFKLQSKYCPTITNANFEFTADDLFIKDNNDNDKYYFQIIFNTDGLFHNWVFGKPLFKKYQMVFDQDKKTYGFYLENNFNIINTLPNNIANTSTKISWILVVFLLIVSLGLLYALHKLLPKIPRKLKANELEENFSYEASNTKSKYSEISDSNNDKNQLYASV